MEILAEILFSLLAWLAELLLQVVLEALAGAGLRSLKAPFRPAREVSPVWAAVGYTVYGAGIGGLSLLVFPAPWLESTWARIANLAVTPLAAGAVMALMGAWRRRRGDALLRLDRFSYGVLFAFSLALVRYFFAEAQ
jgi:hypothetical protein